MLKPTFTSADELANRLAAYFEKISDEHLSDAESLKAQNVTLKKNNKEEPATITGLALFLGFDSRKSFDNYTKQGRFAKALKRGLLQVEAEYEKKLHQPSPAGAVFVLKSLGWNEKPDTETGENQTPRNITIKVIGTGIQLASNEKEVNL